MLIVAYETYAGLIVKYTSCIAQLIDRGLPVHIRQTNVWFVTDLCSWPKFYFVAYDSYVKIFTGLMNRYYYHNFATQPHLRIIVGVYTKMRGKLQTDGHGHMPEPYNGEATHEVREHIDRVAISAFRSVLSGPAR